MSKFDGKKILVTGGTGSIGSEIVKQLLIRKPKNVLVYARDDSAIFFLKREINDERVEFVIGDIREARALRRVFNRGIDIVVHAAALKHVSLCEEYPVEAVETNIIGTQNIIDLSIEFEIESVLTISTDKAANPSSVMGATKYISERLTINADEKTKTNCFCVRFGNVLGSRGSVFPALSKSIKEKGEIDITDYDVTRFLMPISVAANLVLDSFNYSTGGEVFVMKMKSMRLGDLVEAFKDVLVKHPFEVNLIGIQDGEKMHEELIMNSESNRTWDNGEMYIISPNNSQWDSSGIPKAIKVDLSSYDSSGAIFFTKNELRSLVKDFVKKE